VDDKDNHHVSRSHSPDPEEQTQRISNSPHDPESSAQPIQTSAETPPHAPARPDNSSPIQNGNAVNGHSDSGVPPTRSGGPRTKRGKEKSNRNATKHGIFSAVVLPEESEKMYQDIFRAALDYIKPEDDLERIIVEKLAVNLWRYKRLILSESTDVVNISARARMEMMLAGGRDLGNREMTGQMMADGAHSATLERGIEMMRKLRDLIQERGFDLDADIPTLFSLFGPVVEGRLPNPTDLYGYWRKYSEVKTGNKEPKDGIPLKEAKKHAIDMLDQQIRWAERRVQCLKPFETFRAALLFPSEIAIEKIMLYEAHLGREFDRTLQQIERLRRMKKGQPTPAPIEVKLST
jgi:hypothetical protein